MTVKEAYVIKLPRNTEPALYATAIIGDSWSEHLRDAWLFSSLADVTKFIEYGKQKETLTADDAISVINLSELVGVSA